jgi:two-component system phosphate regulon sensor histidine kinase PhoR
VANVSHELRTPLASIQASAETLLDGGLADAEAAPRFLEVIHRNAGRLARLVADLLTLSRLEARPGAPAPRRPVPLADVAEAVMGTVRDQAAAQQTRLECDVPGGVVALGDADGVEQMLLNLVDNALRYGRPGGLVRVEARRDGAHVELAVQDDGRGIESRHLPRIFERFYRVDAARSRDDGGTGLGLAIVRHLAESMGGSVGVHSELGRGSRFHVRLPAAP